VATNDPNMVFLNTDLSAARVQPVPEVLALPQDAPITAFQTPPIVSTVLPEMLEHYSSKVCDGCMQRQPHQSINQDQRCFDKYLHRDFKCKADEQQFDTSGLLVAMILQLSQ
jgi:hypothetical protein